MISTVLANITICISLLVALGAYFALAKREGSYVNIMAPTLIASVPAYYLLPLIYISWFGTSSTAYAHIYVYAALAVENVVFVYAYTHSRRKILRLPLGWSYRRFTFLAVLCLVISGVVYAPILLQFGEFLLDPRQIYNLTRSGFGLQYFLSSTLAYLAIILILFTRRSLITKSAVILLATGLLLLHGSKAQALNVVFILVLHHVYVKGHKVRFKGAVLVCASVALITLSLFAATMALGDGPREILESLSSYSDYTRNAMLVIDSHVPLQYGRLAIESNTIALVPRGLMPNKPRNFGSFYLTDKLFPEWFDADTSPAFGIGVPYADFGSLAIVYIALFAWLRGWLARVFVNRVESFKHPGDFFVLVFLADITLFPLGVGWFLPEALLVGLLLRYLSTIGASRVYIEPRKLERVSAIPRTLAEGTS